MTRYGGGYGNKGGNVGGWGGDKMQKSKTVGGSFGSAGQGAFKRSNTSTNMGGGPAWGASAPAAVKEEVVLDEDGFETVKAPKGSRSSLTKSQTEVQRQFRVRMSQSVCQVRSSS